MASKEFFDPRNPHIGFSGKDQDKPQGINVGNSETIRKLGELMGGDQGFENTQDAVIREYGSSVSIAGLGARVSTLEAQISVDATFSDNFNRGFDSPTLGSQKPGTIAPWIQFGDGQELVIENDAAVLSREALFNLMDDGTQYARCPVLAGGNDFAVIGIVNPRQERLSTRARTSLYGRCNAAGTEGIYADFYGDRCALGRFTRSGNTMTRTQWKPRSDRSIGQASTFELQMDENQYRLVVDNEVLVDWIDDTGYPRDAAHRTAMFSEMCWTPSLGSFAPAEFSVGVTGFAIRSIDLSAVARATTAAKQATDAAEAVTGIATEARDTADQAQATADSVAGVADAANGKAQLALDSVQAALDGAQQQPREWMISSAGVVLGRNEVNIGPVVVYPANREFRATSVTYGLEQNTGSVTIQLLKISPSRVATVLRTTTLSSGEVEKIDGGLNILIERGYRLAGNVIAVSGTASVLICSVDGALL